MEILVGLVLVGSIAVVALQQQQASAFGLVERQQIGDFMLLTANFEKAVISALPPEVPMKIGDFRKLTAQFERDVINAVLVDPPEPDKILRLHQIYADKVLNIFLGGPDTIPGLLDAYSAGVKRIFGLGQPR